MEPFGESPSLASRTTLAILVVLCAFATFGVFYPAMGAIFWMTERSYGYALQCLAIAAVAPTFAWLGWRRGRRRGDTASRRRQRAAGWYAASGFIVAVGWSLAAILATGI